MIHSGELYNASVLRQKGESRNGCLKKTKHAKFSEKRTFFIRFFFKVFFETPVCEIRPFVSSPANDTIAEAYSESSQTSRMEISAKIVYCLKRLTIAAKISWLVSNCASVFYEFRECFHVIYIFLRLKKVVMIQFIVSENGQWFILHHQIMIAISHINFYKVLASRLENVKCDVASMNIVQATFISPCRVFLCPKSFFLAPTKPAFTCSKSIMETPEQCVKFIQT